MCASVRGRGKSKNEGKFRKCCPQQNKAKRIREYVAHQPTSLWFWVFGVGFWVLGAGVAGCPVIYGSQGSKS